MSSGWSLAVSGWSLKPKVGGAAQHSRKMLYFGPLAVLLWLSAVQGQRGSYVTLVEPQDVLLLPELPYGYDSLTPHLDSATLRVHHQGHHKAYTDKTNAALAQWRQEVKVYCRAVLSVVLFKKV